MRFVDKLGGRGYPDVSAIGDFYVIRAQGQFGRVGVSTCPSHLISALDYESTSKEQ